MQVEGRLRFSLLLLRLGVFVVMFMWTLDKFVNPAHTASVFERYYHIAGLSEAIIMGVGSLQLILVVCFLLGIKKTLSYGLILLMHLASTLSTFPQYLNPWLPKNLLFFAAWPMLAACLTLYLLRSEDTLLVFRGSEKKMFI